MSIHVIIIFLSNFYIIFLTYSFFFFLTFTFSLTFIPPLPFHLPITLYFNITLHFSLHLPLFCLFLFHSFTIPFSLSYLFISPLPSILIALLFIFPFIFPYFVSSYSHHFTINLSFFSSILCIVFPHKKILSLSQFFGWFFFFLHLYFRLINFCII